MSNEFLPFSRPSITEEDVSAVGDVLRSGWITTGGKAAEFEDAFREYVGCAGAVALASATAGMHLALRALDVGPGDEVITPSMTWVFTVNLIVLAGATRVFADIDRDTLMVSRETIRQSLTDRTRLIIPVHFAGAAADMNPIRELAREKKSDHHRRRRSRPGDGIPGGEDRPEGNDHLFLPSHQEHDHSRGGDVLFKRSRVPGANPPFEISRVGPGCV